MRIFRVILVSGFLLAGMACNSTNQQRTKEEANADLRKTTDAAKRAGDEIKTGAKELTNRVDAAVQPDSVSASDKLAHAEQIAKTSASRAGVKLDHAAMLAKVKSKLVSDAGLSTLTNVDVSVVGGVVTLSGKVASADQKSTVERAASQVDGVNQVVNHLTVEP